MLQGYIKLYRQIQDNEDWIKEKFDKQRAWIDLILMAQHKDTMFSIRDNNLLVKRGQVAIADRVLAMRWKWSRDKVRRFINALETAHQIRPQKNHLISVYTIVNYEKYQENKTANKTTDKTTDKTINKNVKNKEKTLVRFEEFWKEYPRPEKKKKAFDKFMKIDINRNFEKIMKALEIYKKSNDWIKENGKYIPHAISWLNGERWNDEFHKSKNESDWNHI